VAADRYICGECCVEMYRGFSLDMKRIVTAKEVEQLGFHHAAKRVAVSGGLLIRDGITTTEQ